jgi:hypothetical protein
MPSYCLSQVGGRVACSRPQVVSMQNYWSSPSPFTLLMATTEYRRGHVTRPMPAPAGAEESSYSSSRDEACVPVPLRGTLIESETCSHGLHDAAHRSTRGYTPRPLWGQKPW